MGALAAMAPASDSGIKVRGGDLLEALRIQRFTTDTIIAVPAHTSAVEEVIGSEAAANRAARDVYYADHVAPRLRTFVNGLDDGDALIQLNKFFGIL